MIYHVIDNIINGGGNRNGVQITFLKELINILDKGQSRERNISKKVINFFKVKIKV